MRSWQATYRGTLPDEYLDSLDLAARADRWRQVLSRVPDSRSAEFVAVSGPDVLGFVSVGPCRDEGADTARLGEVRAIYLHPDAWDTGAGAALMTRALASLADGGYAEAMLWVLDGNARARRFYEKGGWRPDGTERTEEWAGAIVDEVRYRRPLP